MSEPMPHAFRVTATWDLKDQKGQIASENAMLTCPHSGDPSLGGVGGAPNPEELLASAVASCFVQTWAIFLGKLKVPLEAPVVEATATVDKDPAGGFRVTRIDVAPRIPSGLYAGRRADLDKTLQLAEKYCIISKSVKGDGSVLHVAPNVS
jgi:organic hydroperoxide reductase OsmC/OhrA